MSPTALPDFTACRVLVVGDVMLDRYWFGDVNRISPEAPVPVVLVKRTEERPGGAANVARNITALGGHATLLSVVGEDEAGRSLEDLLLRSRVIVSLHRDPELRRRTSRMSLHRECARAIEVPGNRGGERGRAGAVHARRGGIDRWGGRSLRRRRRRGG